jgi:hypothetical protein
VRIPDFEGLMLFDLAKHLRLALRIAVAALLRVRVGVPRSTSGSRFGCD